MSTEIFPEALDILRQDELIAAQLRHPSAGRRALGNTGIVGFGGRLESLAPTRPSPEPDAIIQLASAVGVLVDRNAQPGDATVGNISPRVTGADVAFDSNVAVLGITATSPRS